MLIGEPGVGKTAIVEGLAQRILAGDVPESLKARKIFIRKKSKQTNKNSTSRFSGEMLSRFMSICGFGTNFIRYLLLCCMCSASSTAWTWARSSPAPSTAASLRQVASNKQKQKKTNFGGKNPERTALLPFLLSFFLSLVN